MKELNGLLIDAIKRAGGYIEQGIDFAAEQAPDLIRQLILWNIAFHAVFLVFGLLLAIVTYKLVKFAIKGYHENPRDDEGYVMGGFFGGILGTIASTILILVNLTSILQLWLAPKVWLLEYAAKLVKGQY